MSFLVLSLVHADLSCPVGVFTVHSLQRAKRRYCAILRRSGIRTFIGGLDFSVNEDSTGRFLPHFQPQAWVLGLETQVRRGEATLRAQFTRTESVQCGVMIKRWDGNPAALAYAMKGSFDRRVGYWRKASKDGERHACWDTRDRPLRAAQQIELLIALDQAGHQERLILGGYRVVRTADGPMIRPMKRDQ